jgi:outer membrane protein assembly factor BamC
MKSHCLKPISSALLLAVTVSGCGTFSALDSVVPDSTQEYRRADTMPPLDVPPDLSTARINDDIVGSQASSATYSEFEQASKNPLATKYNIVADKKPSLAGEGDTRRLIIPGDKDQIWEEMLNFWAEKNIGIARKDSRISLMDTEATADNYAYRVRLERDTTPNAVAIYLSGTGVDDNSQKNETMLRQAAEYFGGLQQQREVIAQQQRQTQPQASIANVVLLDEAGGHQALVVEQDYTDVWSRVGRVLDSKGFAVEDRDRSRGVYYVRYIDPFNDAEKEEEGWFSSLAFWKDDDEKSPGEYYYIKLISDAAKTKIIVLDTEEIRTSSDTAKRLLGLIQEQLAR